MGTGSSKKQERLGDVGATQEQRKEEALAASTGALPMLQNAFSRLSVATETNTIPTLTLEENFSLSPVKLQSESSFIPESFPALLANLGPSLVGLLFKKDDSGVHWVDFLRGYNRCCGRVPLSTSLTIIFRIYSAASRKTKIPINLEFDSDEDDCKVTGVIKLNDVLMLLWMCWIMEYASRTSSFSKERCSVVLPDISCLVASAFTSCSNIGDNSSIMDPEDFSLDKDISAQKLQMWILAKVPGLAHCIAQYALVRLESTVDPEAGSLEDFLVEAPGDHLLNRGNAWAVSLSHRSAMKELSEACFTRKGSDAMDGLLYRSSIHGKGLSRFWSNVEGYHSPLLILLSAGLANTSECNSRCRKWIVAILTGQGVENSDAFYGSSGSLFALSPIYRVFPASGKDKNFIYCHLRPTVRLYDPNPKPIGLAFGGTVRNERILIDEDFAKMTVRHHAVDKTYQPGRLFPNQGFLATEASIFDVEVWGLGGKSAKEHQDAYKRRELLFSEQRRKVDLKTFSSWEDSPEKMMLDMVSDPNAVQREDR